MNMKWVIDLNVKAKAINLPKENTGKMFCNLGLIKDS
jgi:hypothetical protein